MAAPLPDLNAIWHHLKARGAQSIIPGAYLSMQARIGHFRALVDIQFRRARLVRVSVSLPIRILPDLRPVYALAVQELNRTSLGCGIVMSATGVSVYGQILLGDGPLTGEPLDRTIALVIERATAALPVVEGIRRRD